MSAVIDPFHRALRAILEEELQGRKEALCSNLAADIEDYRFRCGYLVALMEVLAQCGSVEADMYGGERPPEDDS